MAQQGFMQPSAGFGSPLMGPDIAAKQYQMAQRQAYAQALMQQGMEPLQGQNVGGHYVAPSWTQGLAKALGGYMGMKAMADMPKQQQELQDMQLQRQAQMFGLGQPSGSVQSFPVGPSGAGQAAPTQGMQPAGQPQLPLLPGRSAQESFMVAQGMGLPAYLKLAAEQGFQKPLVVGEGATVYNPISGKPEFSAAKNGIQTTYGLNGPMAAAVPGYGAANAGIQGQEAGAVANAKLPAALAEQAGAASVRPAKYIGPDGREYSTNDLDLSQGRAGMPRPGGAPSGGGVVVGNNPITQGAALKINDDWIANTYRPTLDSGKAASDLSSSLQAVRSIPLGTGWGTEAKAAAANFLTSLGVAPDSVSQYASDAQKFQSVAMDRLLNTLKAQAGVQTEGDANRASQTFARLGNTPQANQFIVDFAQAQANQQMRKAQYYEAAMPLARQSGDLTKVDREWRKIQGSIWNDPVLSRYRPQERK